MKKAVVCVSVALVIAGCGGGGGGTTGGTGSTASNTHSISVTVSGLNTPGLVLHDNGGDALSVAANGVSTFATALASGAAYSVTVAAQPGGTAQLCSVANGSGTVGTSDVTDITVTCRDVAHFAYVANSDNTISEYTVDPVTGALASVGSPQVFGKAGATITKVASDPAGNYVFFLDMTNKQLLSATIDRSSGALAAADAIALPGGGPETLAVSPDGKFVYVANFSSASPATPNSGVLAIFAVLPGGKLSPSGTPALTELNVYSMTIDASGRHLYVSANSTGGPVNVFALDPASGSAHFLGLTGSPSGIRGTVLSPTGFAYELASGDVVDAYPVLSDGTFGGVTGQTTLAGSNNNALTMDGQGRFVYVTELDPFVHRISVLKADAKTGALSAGKDFITTAAAAPQAITADPTGRFVYTANANDSVSAFSIDGATGTLTQVGTNLTNSSSPAARPFSIVLTK